MWVRDWKCKIGHAWQRNGAGLAGRCEGKTKDQQLYSFILVEYWIQKCMLSLFLKMFFSVPGYQWRFFFALLKSLWLDIACDIGNNGKKLLRRRSSWTISVRAQHQIQTINHWPLGRAGKCINAFRNMKCLALPIVNYIGVGIACFSGGKTDAILILCF